VWPFKFIVCQGRPLWLLAPRATDDTSGVQSERGHIPPCMCQLACLFCASVTLPSILRIQIGVQDNVRVSTTTASKCLSDYEVFDTQNGLNECLASDSTESDGGKARSTEKVCLRTQHT